MVGVNIQSRLGNQLFQYAFIKALAEELNTSFYINQKTGLFSISDYFELRGYHPFTNSINRIILKLYSKNMLKKLQGIDVDIQTPKSELKNNGIYNGHFQSEFFFSHIINHISSYISVKKNHIKLFEEKYGSIFKNKTIAIHVRRGDYLKLNNWWIKNLGSNDLSLPISYYFNCLSEIKNVDDYKILFVSDDIDFVKKEFSHIKNAIFSNSNLIIDFQIILNADICIIANSTFAWWAAYLNNKKYKKIYCPKYWLGFKIKKEYPDRIIPASWLQIETN